MKITAAVQLLACGALGRLDAILGHLLPTGLQALGLAFRTSLESGRSQPREQCRGPWCRTTV